MPLSKKQIAQRKNFKNRSNNSSTGQFEESKVSDSSDSDFILSDEIYSSDSSINISDTDTEMTLEQDKKDIVNFNLISIDDKKRRKNPSNKLEISRATKFRRYGPSGKFTKAAKDTKKIDQFFKKNNNGDNIINIDEIILNLLFSKLRKIFN